MFLVYDALLPVELRVKPMGVLLTVKKKKKNPAGYLITLNSVLAPA